MHTTIKDRGSKMKFYYNLYLSEEYQNKKKRVIKKLEKMESPIDQYLIILVKEGENHLEIFNSILLKQNIYNQDELFVIGIADALFDAYAMVEKITQEVYNETGTTNIKDYLLKCQREYEEGNV